MSEKETIEIQNKNESHSWGSPKMLWIIELGIVFAVSIVIGVAFALYGRGGPISSDITMYMNLGLNGIKMPFVLNRYFHVFLQAIFMALSSHPVEGYHAFWGFIIGLNTFLVYIAARKVLKRSNFLHGILAVMIFFSFTAIAETSGVIVVDFTAMTMLTGFFATYIYSMDQDHQSPWLIGLLGALFFFAFKTKETTLPVGILFIGLGWVREEKFKIKTLLKNLLWVLCGVVVGILIFAVLSWIFLGDPFFGLRISEWQEFFGTYAVYSSRVLETLNSLGDGNLDDWYQGYWFELTLLPFVFYLISGVTLHRNTDVRRKLLWLVPLMYALFMIVSINNRLGYETRFGLPVMPVLAVLAPQFIDLKWPETRKDKIKLLIVSAIGLVIFVGIRVVLRLIIPAQNLDLGSVITLMYFPILITILFASLFIFRDNLYGNVVNYLIVFSLMVSPVASNLRTIFIIKENHHDFTNVVLPFSEFDDAIVYSDGMQMYATYDVFDQYSPKIGKNIDEMLALFNVYFNASATRENFVFVEVPESISEDILAEPFDYVLITMHDWIAMQDDPDLLEQVRARYSVEFGAGGDFVLLTRIN